MLARKSSLGSLISFYAIPSSLTKSLICLCSVSSWGFLFLSQWSCEVMYISQILLGRGLGNELEGHFPFLKGCTIISFMSVLKKYMPWLKIRPVKTYLCILIKTDRAVFRSVQIKRSYWTPTVCQGLCWAVWEKGRKNMVLLSKYLQLIGETKNEHVDRKTRIKIYTISSLLLFYF